MSTKTLASAALDLTTCTARALAADQVQGLNRLQHAFLNKLQLLRDATAVASEIISSVESHLAPNQNWKATLDISILTVATEDFRRRISTNEFEVVGTYDNLNSQLISLIAAIKKACDSPWQSFRTAQFASVRLDYEYPNEHVLRAIAPNLRIPASFPYLKSRLSALSTTSFSDFWDRCGGTESGFAAGIQELQRDIADFQDVIMPVAAAVAETPSEVARFLEDAAKGSASLAQALSSVVSDWIATADLRDSFVLRFSEGI